MPALATVPNGKGSGGKQPEQEGHGHKSKQDDMEGPLSSATVSFGQWDLTTPLDRFPNVSDRNRNNHKLIPGTVDIKAGGSVNFIISGFHHILIYDDGTKPSDIHYTMTVPTTVQPGPPLDQRSRQADLPGSRPQRDAAVARRRQRHPRRCRCRTGLK